MSDERPESQAIALRFLQTVVVVDDRAYPDQNFGGIGPASLGDEEPEGAAFDALEVGQTEDGSEASVDIDLDELDPLGFDTETIVEGFADLGMNCAVLAPNQDEEIKDEQRLGRLASRSDVVILDWVIRPRTAVTQQKPSPAGRTSLGLLLKVLRGDVAVGGARIRLVCIYTGESDVAQILDSVETALKKEFPQAPRNRDGLRLDIGAARIIVLGKMKPVPVPGVATVAAAELPSRIVVEFTDFVATGLLPEIALQSLSAVRDQGHRLLRRFSGDLDPALLSHRSFTSSADAEQFALSLVGSELAAIVAAANVAAPLRDDRVEEAIAQAFNGRSTAYYWKSMATANESQLPAADAIKALTLGVEGGNIRGSTQKIDKKASRSSLMLSGEPTDVRAKSIAIDLGFSALSSLARDRTFEGEGVPLPTLQLGAILVNRIPKPSSKDGEVKVEDCQSADEVLESDEPDTNQYWVCLQPLCDGIRLAGPTKFPMLPLQLPSSSNSKFEFVVKDDGAYVPLQNAASKISQLELLTFDPDVERQAVLPQWDRADWVFTDSNQTKFVWLGNLRLDKAHKLLHSVVTTAGRIGIDEYEFLRLGYA